MIMSAGDIVTASYNGFEGEPKIGIFLIIYNERDDRKYTSGHTNINCVKITSNNFLGNSYVVRLRPGDGNLDKDCIINLSKVHVLAKTQIHKKIGHLNSQIMLNVFKELREFNNEVERQVIQNMQ